MNVDFEAVWVSIQLALWTTITLLVLGLPLAYWLAVTRWRLKFLIEAIVVVPMILPPTVLGFYILIAVGPLSPLGRTYEAMVGRSLAFSFEGLWLASVLYSLPFAVRPFTAAFASVDRRLVEASWCLGVSRLRTFLRVAFPLSWAGILTGVILSFAHTLGEFGVVLMVGGNIPGITRTVSISIYDEVQAVNYSQAAITSLVLLAFSFLALSVTQLMNRKTFS
jgi:molybdate transport system permease protein